MTTRLTPEQLARLPKYAQDEIRDLKADRDAARHDADALRDLHFPAKPGEPGPRVSYATADGQDLQLPPRARVEFDVEGGRVSIMIVRGQLKISTPDGGLILRPQSSNVADASVDAF